MKLTPHLLLYAAMWTAVGLGLWQYLKLRGKQAIPLPYWLLLGLLALLQLYGETFRR